MKKPHTFIILFVLLAMIFSTSGVGITHASPLLDVLPSGLNGNGPGGVGTTDGSSVLELWLRPDRGVYTNNLCSTAAANGNTVYCWVDQSGNGMNVTQATATNRPSYVTNVLNSQPTIQFDGVDNYFNVPAGVIQGRTAFSFFTAFRWNAVSNWQRLWDFGQNTTRNGFVTVNAGGSIPRFAITIGGGGAEQRLTFSSALPTASAQLIDVIWGPPNGTGWRNGNLQSSGAAYTLTPNSLGAITQHYIGRSIYPDPYLNANIGEFIVYSSALNDTNRILVDNYLSSKYTNVALGANDVYAGDTAGNGNFDLDVAGIGQFGGNQHTASHAAGIIVVNGTFLNANGDWLLFGHNTATNVTTTADLPATGTWLNRWTRNWYMDMTNAGVAGGTVDIIFDFSDSGLGGTPTYPVGAYRLLSRAGTTGAFSDVTAASGATVAIFGDQVQFLGVNVSLLDGQKFTLGVGDTTSPTVGIVVTDTALIAGETSLVTFTFSEAVTGFDNTDLTIANGALSAVSSSDGGVTWTATLMPTAGITDATNVITLNNTGVTDIAGNPGIGTTDSNNYAIDTARPTVGIVVADTVLIAGETSLVTFTFSEAVTGFTNADLTIANGTLSAVSSSDGGVTWTGTLTPTAGITDATNVITLDNTGVADPAGNTGSGTTDSNNYAIDTTALTVTVEQATTQADPTNVGPILFTATFGEPINTSTFTAADVVLSASTAPGLLSASLTEIAPNDGTTFEISVSGMSGSGGVVASIAVNTVQDLAGNNNDASNSTDNTVTYDVNALTVTMEQATTQSDPTNVGPILFTATFGEPINTSTFTAADVVLSASTAPGLLSASLTEIAPNDGTTFEISVSGMSGNGDVIASIAVNTVQDLAGNDNDASTSTDNTVTYDNTNPIVASTDLVAGYTGAGPSNFTVTFSKDVSVAGGTTGADSATNPANYLLVDKVNGTADTASCGPVPGAGGVQPDDTQVTVSGVTYDNATFTATVTLPGSLPIGSYRLFICGTTSIVDLAGNPLNGGNDYTFDFVVNRAPSALPATGFPQGRVTVLPAQPASKAYTSTDMILEIPSLNQKMTIVGVPQTEKSWDVSWLGNNAGWLAGSAYPTWNGNTVLTGHVWDSFNRPGPFADLKNLKYGDQFFIHAYGITYTYEVRENKTYWAKTAISKVFQHEELDWVTLVTCETYNPVNGDYFFRRAVRAVLISVK